DWERICLFASHVGASERLLETAIAYARTRTQFGQPIGKYQAVAHRIADMKVNLEAARLLTYRAAWRLDHARSATPWAARSTRAPARCSATSSPAGWGSAAPSRGVASSSEPQ